MMQTMTVSQIDEAVVKYRALLEKHSEEFSFDSVRTVLDQSELAREQFDVFRRRAEAVSNLIVRKVKVNRSRTQQEAIEATGRVQHMDRKVVNAMPKGEGDEAEVVFFKPDLSERNGLISDDDLDKEYELRGLKPADPISVAAVNEADPAFADQIPHSTHWKDVKGNWCFAAFSCWSGKRRGVEVHRDGGDWGDWGDGWWFAGVRE